MIYIEKIKGTCIKTDSLNEGKSLSKNGSPVTFLIEKTDDDYSLFFFINRIKGKVIIDYSQNECPSLPVLDHLPDETSVAGRLMSLSAQSQHLTDYLRHSGFLRVNSM